MPVIVDPDSILPDKAKGVKPSMLVLWLLFPVVFAVGFTVGLVVGIKQGQGSVTTNNTNRQFIPTSVIPNANSHITTNTTNANTNVSNAFVNLSNSSTSGDYLKLTAAQQSQLDTQQQQALTRLVDQTATVPDIVRQRDLISIKFSLQAYALVEGHFPSTNSQPEKIEGKDGEVLYQALKTFYGGSYNLRIDPVSPAYYYGYTSDGASFQLTAYLVSKKKTYIITDQS